MNILRVAFLLTVIVSVASAQEVRVLPKEVQVESGRVSVSGRWVVATPMHAPLMARVNSVAIECDRATGTCHEAVAALYTAEDAPGLKAPFLASSLTTYRIHTWDATHIVAVADKPAYDVTIDIDLRSGQTIRTDQETKSRGNQTANPDVIYRLRLE